MEPLDIEQMARARAEASGAGLSFELRGTTFEMIPLSELLFEQLELLDADLRSGITELLGPQAEKFWEQKPTAVEMMMLREQTIGFYARGAAGESAASRVSSKQSSRRSRPASKPTTAST